MGKTLAVVLALGLALSVIPLFAAPPSSPGASPLVCLDPGHGGHDQGAVSNGLEEKEINLDVSLRAVALLNEMGYRVLLTRQSDVYISLQDRCDMANGAGATIFVSVHNNASSSEAQGTETFCYYDSGKGRKLATYIQDELLERLKRPDRGVKEAGFYVLRNTNMPAALLEGAFLTNTDDAEFLKSTEFRQKMAEAVAAGVNEYFLDEGTTGYVFNGWGRGHGVGLCMDGVLYRAEEGQSYRDIISYYYTGVGFGNTDEGQPIRVKCRDGQIRTYSMKDYLYRLVEEPDDYPFEGLKVLYLAARTYTLSCIARHKHTAEGFDICSSASCCQAFDENKDIAGFPNSCAAVDATGGEIITYDQEPIVAAYHGSCGGHTENIEDVWGGTPLPYLRGKPCGYCQKSPRFAWTADMTKAELESALNASEDTAVGTLHSIDLSDRTPGGRVSQATLVGSSAVRNVSGSLLSGRLGFDSTKFELIESPYRSTFYFAEGYTGDGYQEYLCIGNPNSQAAIAVVTYMFTDGTTMDSTYTIPGESRHTVNVGSAVGPNREVSTRVISEAPDLMVERPMYFNYMGKWAGGHNTKGAAAPSPRWYFAEGTTLQGFDEWITVQNPGPTDANLNFRYMVEGEGEVIRGGQVPAKGRATFLCRDQVGEGKNISLLLESDKDVVAERPVYFDYRGLAVNQWRGGHCVVGASAPADEWYFAEGCTRAGFEEWLCIQNPNDSEINVIASYINGEGQGGTTRVSYKVPPRERRTISVNDQIGPEKDVSMHLTCEQEFIAERPMYFLYRSSVDGGHDVLGANTAEETWYFAEGYTGPDFDEWICVLNPGSSDANLEVTYYPRSSPAFTKRWKVAGNSRRTIEVDVDAGPNLEISARVISDHPVVCERPIYFRYSGVWPGGHNEVGCANAP